MWTTKLMVDGVWRGDVASTPALEAKLAAHAGIFQRCRDAKPPRHALNGQLVIPEREANRSRVRGGRERLGQPHGPAMDAVMVADAPGRQAQLGVLDQAVGGEAPLQGRQVDEQLERRAGLPLGIGGVVELQAAEVRAANHGEDLARR
jgi:hypothetical protein